MSDIQKKYLDYEGVKHLWNKINMQDYPNNTILINVIESIDEVKADRSELVQSDWNQNDEVALDYIKNRPFYSEDPIKVTIYEEETVTIGSDLYIAGNNKIILSLDEIYLVNINGVEYECISWNDSNYLRGTVICLGNGTLLGVSGHDNGEPFVIEIYSDGTTWLNVKEEGDYTFSISEMVSEIHQIDMKYVPHDKTKMDCLDPTGIGSFSMNRKDDSDIGLYSYTEGFKNSASGFASHAEGNSTIASGDYSHVQGQFNIEDTENKYAHIVGNGGSVGDGEYINSNAHTLDWDGNAWYQGDIYVGSTSGTNRDDGSKKLATEEYVNNSIPEIPVTSVNGETGDVVIDIPETLPNPSTLTINGISYDGSADVSLIAANDEYYYGSLFAAMTALSSNIKEFTVTNVSEAKVKVFRADNGKLTAMLLDNITESFVIDVYQDVDLVLNGKTLTFNTNEAMLNYRSGTSCAIDGTVEGSSIVKTVDTLTAHRYCINTAGNELILNGVSASIQSLSGNNYCVITLRATNAVNKLELNNCQLNGSNVSTVSTLSANDKNIQSLAKKLIINNSVLTINSSTYATSILAIGNIEIVDSQLNAVTQGFNNDGFAKGIEIQGASNLIVKDSTIIADAPNAEADTAYSTGIQNYSGSTTILDNVYVFGTHSGISNKGNLYINGGTYTGYSHGGIYFGHGAENVAYVNDAILRCDNYEGIFDYAEPTEDRKPLAGFYIGGGTSESNSNMVAYIDNCTIGASGYPAFVIRGTSGETNITSDNITHPEYAEFTNLLYRKNNNNKVLDGNDYEALKEIIPIKVSELKNDLVTRAEVGQIICITAIDENGIPTAWEAVDPWIITSSTENSTKQFKLTIDDDGILTATEIVENTV